MIDPKAYIACVDHGDSQHDHRSRVLCVVYFLEESCHHRGFQFYQLYTTLPAAVTGTGAMSFSEQLVQLNSAVYADEAAAALTDDVIRQKLRETYGSSAKIRLNELEEPKA